MLAHDRPAQSGCQDNLKPTSSTCRAMIFFPKLPFANTPKTRVPKIRGKRENEKKKGISARGRKTIAASELDCAATALVGGISQFQPILACPSIRPHGKRKTTQIRWILYIQGWGVLALP